MGGVGRCVVVGAGDGDQGQAVAECAGQHGGAVDEPFGRGFAVDAHDGALRIGGRVGECLGSDGHQRFLAGDGESCEGRAEERGAA